jgi:hypothetical protein
MSAANKISFSGFVTGTEFALQRKQVKKISLGSKAVDELLGMCASAMCISVECCRWTSFISPFPTLFILSHNPIDLFHAVAGETLCAPARCLTCMRAFLQLAGLRR